MRQGTIRFLTALLLSVLVTAAAYAKQDYEYYKRLINAIGYVESGNNERMVSKNRRHVGFLQISRIAVDEANLILGYRKYSYDDRFSRDKSVEIFLIIQNRHNSGGDIKRAIRVWNEGPFFNRKVKTTKYVRKVMRRYDAIEANE